VAGSTHDGEDEIILRCFDQLKSRHPELLLVLVPRHPERFNAVARLVDRSDHQFVRRSEFKGVLPPEVDIVVGDTMGELTLFFSAADYAFVGGSLVASGGHNILEPCALGVPVIFGRHMFHFAEISALALVRGAGKMVRDTDELVTIMDDLLRDAELRFRLGEAGKAMVEENKGALEKTLAMFKESGHSRQAVGDRP